MNALRSDFLELALQFMRDVDTPRSLGIALLIQSGEWDQLSSIKLDPRLYLDAVSYARDSAATAFLKKFRDFPIKVNRRDDALKSFIDAEKRCCLTNSRLDRFINNGPYEPHDEPMCQFLDSLKKRFRQLLGRSPKDLDLRHGPGATFNDPSSRCSPLDKMTSRPTLTASAAHLIPLWSQTAWARGLLSSHPDRSHPEYIRGDRWSSVPKDSRTDRTITIGPSINVAYQLAIGRHMRKRLLDAGLDLNQGQEMHRRLACVASRRGHLATIDLKNASNNVSKGLVRLLASSEWFDLLDLVRSPEVRLPSGAWLRLEMFSGMGNGYTFELETAIFAAVCLACADRQGLTLTPYDNFGVYGDDIIIPVDLVEQVLSCLSFLGFEVNYQKSFWDGNFRESCGGDFFNGYPVRGHYVENSPKEPADWISIANGINRVSENLRIHLDPGFRRSWHCAIAQLPSSVRTCRGPKELGDLVIHDEITKWSTRWHTDGSKGSNTPWVRYIRCWVPVPKRISVYRYSPGPLLAAALYGIDSRGVSPRGQVSGYRIGYVPFS